MRLEGSIRRFGLASVLEFLAGNSATGVLEVRDFEEYGFVYLVEGHVEAISLPVTDELLGNRLVKAGCLDERQLREALIEDAALTPGQKRLKPLGQRLVERGFTNESSVREVMRRQVLDEVFELAHWRNGVFSYDEPAEMPVFQVAIQADVRSLLIDAQRRIERGERPCKSVDESGDELCFECPLAAECSPAIKTRYLKSDICLWRKMTAVIESRPGDPGDERQLYRPETEDPKSILDASLGWH